MNLRIEDMTLEQKIGMVLCARRFEEKEDIDFTLELIKSVHLRVFRFLLLCLKW